MKNDSNDIKVNIVTKHDPQTHNGHEKDLQNAKTTHNGSLAQREHANAEEALHDSNNDVQDHSRQEGETENNTETIMTKNEVDAHQALHITDMHENMMTDDETDIFTNSTNHKEVE